MILHPCSVSWKLIGSPGCTWHDLTSFLTGAVGRGVSCLPRKTFKQRCCFVPGLPRECMTFEDIWGLLQFPRTYTGSSPHWVVRSLKLHSPYTKNCQKIKWALALRKILGFQRQNVFWKQRRGKHRLPLGPPNLVYSVLFLPMNPASVVTWCLPPLRYACREISTTSFYGHGYLLQSR